MFANPKRIDVFVLIPKVRWQKWLHFVFQTYLWFKVNWKCYVIPNEVFSLLLQLASNTFTIRFTGFNALVTHHLKHWSSSFFILMIAFFLVNLMEEEYMSYLWVVHILLYAFPSWYYFGRPSCYPSSGMMLYSQGFSQSSCYIAHSNLFPPC